MEISIVGVILGLCTAGAWSVASIVHTSAARQIGITHVMLIRQPLACLALAACLPLYGLPDIQSFDVLIYATLSGIVGIVLGDAIFYHAAMRVGLTIVQVVESFSACFTLLFGSLLLGESVTSRATAGIFLTTASVILVIFGERGKDKIASGRQFWVGIAGAFTAALCISLSLIFSKKALVGLDTLSLTLLRNIIATLAIYAVARAGHRPSQLLRVVRENKNTLKLFAIGCLCGPAGGIWISCMAIDLLPAAIASSLIGLQPVFLLCLLSVMEKRLPRGLSLIGVCLASCGVYLCV